MECVLLGSLGLFAGRAERADAPRWPARAQASSALDRAAWLAGCWRREAGNAVVDEQWMEPLGGSMLGMTRTVRGGRVVEYEHLRIEARGSDVYLVALPSGQALAEFKLAAGQGPTLVFENPEHDFPKTIRYAPNGVDSLLATIAGDGREVRFPYGRVECPGVGQGLPWPLS